MSVPEDGAAWAAPRTLAASLQEAVESELVVVAVLAPASVGAVDVEEHKSAMVGNHAAALAVDGLELVRVFLHCAADA